MKYYGQFWTLSTGYVEGTIPPVFKKEAVKPIPRCGSDGIMRLSGRQAGHWADILRTECRRRGFVGFSVIAGESLLFAKEIREMVEV